MAATLRIESLNKSYSGATPVHAVKNVTFAISPSEFVAVRGRSGCGKSTLLLAVGGLLRPDQGHVVVCERDLYAMASGQRRSFLASHVGFVFQQFHLVPYLNVLENVRVAELGLKIATPPSRSEELCARFGLSARLRNRPDQLSVGERQRVALARAMVNRPKLILADEPTGNLDPENSQTVLEALREFVNEGGSVLMVTHDDAATSAVDRVFEMDEGRLEETVHHGS